MTRPQGGDAVAMVRVESLANTNSWAKAGLTFRDSVNADAANVTLIITAANGVSLQVRPTGGAATTYTVAAGVSAPVWLRLSRQGNTFTGAYSANGTSWTTVGTKTATVAATAQAGLAVTSHNDSQSTTATFSGLHLDAANSLAGRRALTFRPADFGNPALSGDGADPDGDGLTNFQEFLMDLNPYLADAAATQLVHVDAAGFGLRFRQRKDLAGATRVFQQSTDLVNWTAVTPVSVGVVQDFGNSADYEARFAVTDTRAFFRVRYDP